MYRSMKFAAAGLAMAVLAGCAGLELNRAKGVQPKGSAFSQNLYKGYLRLASWEQSEGDYEDADSFASRAIFAAEGQEFSPEGFDRRKLPKDSVGELKEARARLTGALAAGARTKAPVHAARAQVMFDCWMQEQEENFQPLDIARCRTGYLNALAGLETAMKPPPMVKAAVPKKAEKQRFIVYFQFDSDTMTPESKGAIITAIDATKRIGAKNVYVSGHTDRAGPETYNNGLSDRRAQAVAKALSSGGVSPRLMSLGAFGESLPAVKTKDNVVHKENRRVIIEISN